MPQPMHGGRRIDAGALMIRSRLWETAHWPDRTGLAGLGAALAGSDQDHRCRECGSHGGGEHSQAALL